MNEGNLLWTFHTRPHIRPDWQISSLISSRYINMKAQLSNQNYGRIFIWESENVSNQWKRSLAPSLSHVCPLLAKLNIAIHNFFQFTNLRQPCCLQDCLARLINVALLSSKGAMFEKMKKTWKSKLEIKSEHIFQRRHCCDITFVPFRSPTLSRYWHKSEFCIAICSDNEMPLQTFLKGTWLLILWLSSVNSVSRLSSSALQWLNSLSW